MNRYPLWKNLMILAAVLIAALYALPNLYGQDPSIEVTTLAKNAAITDGSLTQLEATLNEHELTYKRIEKEADRLRIRFNDGETQLLAMEQLQEDLGAEYAFALNLVADVPTWLTSINGNPMSLGLDLRGGIHVQIDVDMETALKNTISDTATDVRSALREEKIFGRIGEQEGGIEVTFRTEEERDRAERIIEDTLQDFEIETFEAGEEFGVRATMTREGIRLARKFALEQNMTTLRNRVNQLGVTEPIVQQQGERRIVIELPGVQDPSRVKDILQATATLEYRPVDTEHSVMDAVNGKVPFDSEIRYDRQGQPVLLKKERIVSGESITNASSGVDQQSGTPAVFVNLDGHGADRMRRFTTESVGKPMAVLFIEDRPTGQKDKDGRTIKKHVEEVISVATIREPFGAHFQTTGLDSQQEARDLALFLRAGALKAPIDIVEERTIGPSLGQESIDKGFKSIVIGLVLVMIFMVIYYRFFGLIANLALLVNLVMIVAILSLLQATLTLPGIAGILLTVGMAVDANVLIFERIREEIRVGSSPQASIQAGYAKALSTILDANITTLIAAVVLFSFGTGPIKGFAVTLFIGIITSMFTAILGTRAVVNLLYGGKRLKTLPLGMKFLQKEPKINFMSKRTLALIFSGAIMVIAVAAVGLRGLNFGIDFTGGTLIEVGYEQDVDLDPVRKRLEEGGYGDATIQRFGTPRDILIRIAPREDVSNQKISNDVFALLEADATNRPELRRVEFVGPQVGDELTEKGGLAMLYSLIAILIYVALRFEWRFAVGSIIALVHDVVFTVGLFAILWATFDLPVLAAILAVIGYSLNDTIVVYDRIRENFRKIRKGSPVDIINISLNQTLSRTMITSLTTFIVLLSLFLFGGEIIHGFALALMIGVVIGTYSSIFVASVAVVMLGIRKEDLMPKPKEGELVDDRP
ncbi:MAG: protein translocase subunit SecD [Gammaproteobacteria bacterium]|jgi:protein-export membrane protein SecD/preprotein translocase SecF subunit